MKTIEPPAPSAIRAARANAGLTQREAARLLHVSARTYQDWERSVARMPVGLWELFDIRLAERRKRESTRNRAALLRAANDLSKGDTNESQV